MTKNAKGPEILEISSNLFFLIKLRILDASEISLLKLGNSSLLSILPSKFIKKLEDNNLLVIRAAENVVRVLPPLNVKKSEIDLAIKIIRKVCSEFNEK